MIVHLNDPRGWCVADKPGELVPINPPPRKHTVFEKRMLLGGTLVPATTENIRCRTEGELAFVGNADARLRW